MHFTASNTKVHFASKTSEPIYVHTKREKIKHIFKRTWKVRRNRFNWHQLSQTRLSNHLWNNGSQPNQKSSLYICIYIQNGGQQVGRRKVRDKKRLDIGSWNHLKNTRCKTLSHPQDTHNRYRRFTIADVTTPQFPPYSDMTSRLSQLPPRSPPLLYQLFSRSVPPLPPLHRHPPSSTPTLHSKYLPQPT